VITTGDMYELLPVLHRVRDDEQFGALQALVQILAEQASVVDDDIAGLYDNWFIETCEPWVVAYIGDILGVRGLYPVAPGTTSQRSYVANTLGYRRRKGTVGVLEQLAFDVTGWRAKAVELFQLLGTTQYVKHLRPFNVRTPDLRDANALELVGGPFEQVAHTAEVRRIAQGRGRYNIPNVGLYLWRLQSYPISRGTARRVGTAADARYTFSPLGRDAPLFNLPRTDRGITDLAQEIDVPAPLRRHALRARSEDYFAATRPVLRVFVRDAPASAFEEVAADEIAFVDLSLWQRPPAAQPGGRAVAVDPERGRMTFPTGVTPNRVEVSYAYGFSADIGGGPYDRSGNVEASFGERVGWQVGVGQETAPVPGTVFRTLRGAIELWNQQDPGTIGVIALLDSRTYKENLTESQHRIELKEGSELLIVAADWPEPRVEGTFVPQARRPHVLGNIDVIGTAGAASDVAGHLVFDGLLLEGPLNVLAGNLAGLQLIDCTLVPDAGGLNVDASAGKRNADLAVELLRSISGPISLADSVPELLVADTVVDAAGADAIGAPGAAARIQATTVHGRTLARTLEAENSIFTRPVVVSRRQVGCVRFSFVPSVPETSTPRRFRCQPDLALKGLVDPDEQAAVRARVVPAFASLEYGRPEYGQLRRGSPVEIRTGADDGAEMGAFYSLRQPQREANLRSALDEYLRFGLEAGVFYVT
jgi:hypothetical protein